MTLDEIKKGESKNIEFKVQLPDDSKKYMKSTDYDEESALQLCSDIRRYIAQSREIPVDKVREVTAVNLENWRIIRKSGESYLPTNAFILLTKNTFRFAKIQCALFKGENRAVFVDRREFDGPVYDQIEEAYQFVLKHINLGAMIDGIVRKDRYELPPESIREAIINSVCHRCYLDHSCVQIAIYDNRVEITSPGMLYGGLTIEQAMAGRSKIRNVCIAEVFSRMGIIEQWGTGIQRMIQGCREYGVREPEFIDMGDAFRVNFYRSGTETGIENGKTGTENTKTGIQTKETGTEINQMRFLNTLSETERKIVEFIIEDPGITQKEIAQKMEMSKNGIRYAMDKLKDRGILEREGATKRGKWIINLLH